MRVFVVAFTLIILSVVSASADEIVLKDGVVLKGKITMETSAKVMIKQLNGTKLVERSLIATLSKSDADPNLSAAPKSSSEKSIPRLGAEFWPPQLDKKYPDLTLYNQHGKVVSLSKIAKGRLILIEPVGMSCKACQAFSGGHQYGPYKGVAPQSNLESIEKYFPQYSQGEELANPNIVFVQLILFDLDMKAPSPESVREWARHFKLANKPYTYVLAGTPEMVGRASFEMIPGFQLVDKNFVLRSDSAGHNPKHNLWQDLLPSIPLRLK